MERVARAFRDTPTRKAQDREVFAFLILPPTTNHPPPITHHQSPTTNHPPPITHHQSPTPNHPPPITHHHSPPTNHPPPPPHHRPPPTAPAPPPAPLLLASTHTSAQSTLRL